MRRFHLGVFVVVGISGLACAALFAQSPGQHQPSLPGGTPSSAQGGYYPANWDGRFGPLQAESNQLLQEYTKATKPEEKQEIRKKLIEAVGKQFDANAQHQKEELEDLEKQIAKLRDLLKKRLDAKTSIVERRLEQLIQEAEGLGWTAPGTSGFRGEFGPGGTRRSSLAPVTTRAPTAKPGESTR
jgi:hypothetical protein